jgi:chromosomal replication initiator protein
MTQSIDEQKLWKAVLAAMEVNLSETNYKTWMAASRAENLTEDSIEIVFPNELAKKKAESIFLPMIQDSVNKIGKGNFKLVFKVGQTTPKPKKDEAAGPLFQAVSSEASQRGIKNGLNPHYTIETYITGGTNQLAYAIASAIISNPGTKYNPFFLYSGVGLGKTHLIQAIGNKISQENPNKKIIYCTGENFTNELIESLHKGKGKRAYETDSFRKKYRTADVLIIDDIQFIAGKEATQEEFFHTFNELYMSQKQIVLASDRPPEEFKNIEERITSRFKSGMMADIQPPDYELRTAILRAKRDEDGEGIPNDVISFIAENINTNIRELEGAYLQVLTFTKATGEEPNVEVAKKALSNIIKADSNKPININNIINAVCSHYAIKQVDIKGKRRTKDIVLPRQVAMYLMYELTGTPYMSIGEVLGGRDHTTVMHGYEKIKREIEQSSSMRKDIITIKQAL